MANRFPMWLLRTWAALLLISGPANFLDAQAYIPTPGELDQLLAPIALYPDALLAQILSASTNPQQVLDANDWLRSRPGLTGTALTNAAQAQGFDPAFIALMNFPQVLDTMARNIDDYAAIGAAFQANQAAVMDSVQRLRIDAYNSGALVSGPQQQVQLEPYQGGQIVVIQPANPQVVYVPTYDPGIVFGGAPGSASWITFGSGFMLAALGGSSYPWSWGRWGWNWRSRYVTYNHVHWRPGSWRYRPPRPIYRPRPPNFSGRPLIRPPQTPGSPGRPVIQPPNRTGQPSTTAVARPTPTRPPHPSNGVRPAPIPSKPRPSQPANGPEQPPTQPVAGPTPNRPPHPSNGVRPAPIPSKPRPSQPSNGPEQPSTQPVPRPEPNRPPDNGARPSGNAPGNGTRPTPRTAPPPQNQPQAPQTQPAPPPSG